MGHDLEYWSPTFLTPGIVLSKDHLGDGALCGNGWQTGSVEMADCQTSRKYRSSYGNGWGALWQWLVGWQTMAHCKQEVTYI